MSELGETFQAMREESQERRQSNCIRSLLKLKESNVPFKVLSPEHLRVGDFDYWPTTGLFIHLKTKKRGRGVHNLLKAVTK